MYKLKHPVIAKKINKVNIVTDNDGNQTAINSITYLATFSNGFSFEVTEEQFNSMFLEI